jgi:hypothetical protein
MLPASKDLALETWYEDCGRGIVACQSMSRGADRPSRARPPPPWLSRRRWSTTTGDALTTTPGPSLSPRSGASLRAGHANGNSRRETNADTCGCRQVDIVHATAIGNLSPPAMGSQRPVFPFRTLVHHRHTPGAEATMVHCGQCGRARAPVLPTDRGSAPRRGHQAPVTSRPSSDLSTAQPTPMPPGGTGLHRRPGHAERRVEPARSGVPSMQRSRRSATAGAWARFGT